MSDTALDKFLNYGTAAERIAFTPVPPPLPTLYWWYETDTDEAWAYDTSWHQVSSPGGTGITELTGDVTAGPGSSSQAATIALNAVTNAKAAQMAAHTIKGNNTGSTANALDLTVAQVNAMLGIQTVTVPLTNAQILALPSLYVEVVPAPGVDRALILHRWVLSINANAGAYTNMDFATDALNGFTVAYGDWNTDASTFCPLPDNGLATRFLFTGGPYVAVPNAAALAAEYPPYGSPAISVDNLPLKLVAWNSGLGDFTGGHADNVGSITVYFSVEDLPI